MQLSLLCVFKSCVRKSNKFGVFTSVRKLNSRPKGPLILGIESSCDDTGAAIVTQDGKILGEALHSQHSYHLAFGGINPIVARDLHEEKIARIVDSAFSASGLTLQDIDAVAATVKPGLPHCLEVGLNFTKDLLRKCPKPFIPIHHMEAHALTVRMLEKLEFPFLVLLVSGGHCLLAVAQSVDEFLLLGSTSDNAPGETFDKVARRLKLRNLPECSQMNGGQAIEYLARKGDPEKYKFSETNVHHPNCQFSFSGLRGQVLKHLWAEEDRLGLKGDELLPDVADLCASFQHAASKHIIKRVNRAMKFCMINNLIPEESKKNLVVSGGVASNKYIKASLEYLCNLNDYKLICPPPKLCTDNGVMIAWNGMEKYNAGIGIVKDPESVQVMGKCPIGKSLIDDVSETSLNMKRIKFQASKIYDMLKQKHPEDYQ